MQPKASKTDINELGLSNETRNALRRNGVHTAEQLLKMTPGDVLSLRGVGKKNYAEIMDRLLEWYRKEKGSRTQ